MESFDIKTMLIEVDEYSVIRHIELGLSSGIVNLNNRIDNSENTFLHVASYYGKIGIVQYLLSRSVDVNARNNSGEIPLHSAILGCNISVVKLLLDSGSNVNTKNYSGLTAIMIAINQSTLEMIQLLIDYGGEVNLSFPIRNDHSVLTVTPLDMAVRHSKIEIIQLLIKKGASVNAIIPETGETPLHSISQGINRLSDKKEFKTCEIAELLLESGANINKQTIEGATPLIYAIYAEDFLLAELFVKHGTDLNMIILDSRLTQFQIITLGIEMPKLIDLCLKHGADYRMLYDCSAYYIAVLDAAKNEFCTSEGNSTVNNKIIQTFWQHGCPYNLPGKKVLLKKQFKDFLERKHLTRGEIPTPSIVKFQMMMFEGIQSNNVHTVRKAIKSGAVARGTLMDIKYPLHFVCSKGYTQVAKVLLENGIKVNNLNDKSETALQLALKFREINVCKLLFQHGACLNFKVESKNLNLFDDEPSKEINELLASVYLWFILVKQGNCIIFDLMKNLIKTDEEMFLIHLNALDKNKRSLMASAMYYGHGEIVEEIMKNRLHCKRRL